MPSSRHCLPILHFRAADRYRENWNRSRSDTIGLSEANNAANAGVTEAYAQAIEQELHLRVRDQAARVPVGPRACDPAAERHAAHEGGEHERLREGRRAEKQLQVVRPDRLVHQPGEAGHGEQREQNTHLAARRQDAVRAQEAGFSPAASRNTAQESSLPSAPRRAAWYWLRTREASGTGRSSSCASCRK